MLVVGRKDELRLWERERMGWWVSGRDMVMYCF